MKRFARCFLCLLLGAILLAGCTSPTLTLTATPTALPSPVPTASPTLPLPATATPVVTPAEPVFTPRPWLDRRIEALTPPNFGALNTPTGMAFAPDGRMYVADSGNHRILHMDRNGNIFLTWGFFEETKDDKIARPGYFKEPWGLAISPDGFLFVADLWNSRIQKFSMDGKFITAWGSFGAGNDPYKLFGPRGLAATSRGQLIVSDTGNHRLVVYDASGNFISQLGGKGSGPGQFWEPVGIALDAPGSLLYVADMWNKRIQVLSLDPYGNLTPKSSWPVNGWAVNPGNSYVAEREKPFLAISAGHIFVTDPDRYAVLEYSPEGTLIRAYEFGEGKGLLTGLAADPAGGLWATDTINNYLFHLKPGS